MAALSGKVGKIEWKGGKVLGLRNWSLDTNTNMTEVTSWTTATEQWRAFVPGLTGAVCSFDGFYDSSSTGAKQIRISAGLSTAVVALTTGTILLYMDRTGGEAFTGSVFWTGQSFAADIDGTVTYGGSAQFNGAVIYATAT